MKVENLEARLRLSSEDGFLHEFHAFWLRESSKDEQYRDPNTGHKLQDAEDIPLDVTIKRITEDTDVLDVEFSDGHRSTYSLKALRYAAEHPRTQELIGEKTPWNGNLDPLLWFELQDLTADPHVLLKLLEDIARLGFALVRGVPVVPNGLAQFIDLVGYMRVTNNGGIEDIKALPQNKVYDLSMTPWALEPHCDNPYRVPQPGYTLLHCIRNDAEGANQPSLTGTSAFTGAAIR